jgi:hypothetical protein
MTSVGGSFLSAGGNEACKEISEQQILSIVQHELMKRFGASEPWDEKTSKKSGEEGVITTTRKIVFPTIREIISR